MPLGSPAGSGSLHHHRLSRRGQQGGMGQDERFGPAAGQLLAGLAGVVGGEGARAVPLFVPGGEGRVHFGRGGLQALLIRHQQQPQTADMFGNDENLKMQEEENRRKLEEERRRKEKERQLKSEEKQKKEEERRKKEQARKNKPNRFASLFGKLTNAVLDDEEEDK